MHNIGIQLEGHLGYKIASPSVNYIMYLSGLSNSQDLIGYNNLYLTYPLETLITNVYEPYNGRP